MVKMSRAIVWLYLKLLTCKNIAILKQPYCQNGAESELQAVRSAALLDSAFGWFAKMFDF